MEVRDFIAQRVNDGEITPVKWIASEYIQSKGNIEGSDLPFYRVCAYAHVREVVKSCVGKYDAKPKQGDPQLVLPGFNYLQKAYTVPRDGVVALVPVDMMTDDELLARANEYTAMAIGCRKHARELKDFVSKRVTRSVAA